MLLYSKIWFNTPRLASAERNLSIEAYGIKPDVLINFLSNEPPVKSGNAYRYPEACLGEVHFLV
jgi:hypothetical protein